MLTLSQLPPAIIQEVHDYEKSCAKEFPPGHRPRYGGFMGGAINGVPVDPSQDYTHYSVSCEVNQESKKIDIIVIRDKRVTTSDEVFMEVLP